MAIQLTENLRRKVLDQIEAARAYLRYVRTRHPEMDLAGVRDLFMTYLRDVSRVSTEAAITVIAILNITHKSISYINIALSTLRFPPGLQGTKKKGQLRHSQGYMIQFDAPCVTLLEEYEERP